MEFDEYKPKKSFCAEFSVFRQNVWERGNPHSVNSEGLQEKSLKHGVTEVAEILIESSPRGFALGE
jgi:hypothetical protein